MTLKGPLRSTEIHTYLNRGRFHACKRKGLPHVQINLQGNPHDCRWPLRLMEDYPSEEPSRPIVHLLMISEDPLKIISDSQWLIQTEASLKPGRKVILGDRQMVLSDQLRAVSGRRRIEDKQMAH